MQFFQIDELDHIVKFIISKSRGFIFLFKKKEKSLRRLAQNIF